MSIGFRAALTLFAGVALLVGYHEKAAPQSDEAECLTPKWHSFGLYQAMNYRNQPDFSAFGFTQAHILDRNIWADERTKEEISAPMLRATVENAARHGGLIVLDIEHFPLRGSDSEVRHSVDRLVDAVEIAREAAGQTPVGYYGLVPLSEYWRAIDSAQHGGIRAWQADNRRLVRIADSVDVNFPSLYTHYDDRDGWVRQAKALVCEARRMSDKPVIAFIWPEFHPGSGRGGAQVPADYWRLQLETLSEIADGVVIWGGYDLARGRAHVWDERAPWWRETLRFLQERRDDSSPRRID